MQTMTNIQDPQKARAYFENKVNFTIGPIELSRQLDSRNINIVDVRETEDYEKGHIPGAVSLPKASWENAARSLSKDKSNVVYCYTQQCHLAATACVAFASKGFPVMELEGGFETWKEKDLRVEQGQQMKAAA
ncbi:MAG TPA: rhodanese-like domain-containing protein [Candidatus Acidoferrales bacterium]|nr:rhodanese-like domain-containing protein [Candidatus Acidoferrales bacterium]